MNDFYRIELPYAVFGIYVRGGKVVIAAPIGKWMLGSPLHQITAWVERKGGTMQQVDEAGGRVQRTDHR